MREFEVNCVARSPADGDHTHITHIGHSNHDWCLRRDAAIKRIEAGFEAFYLVEPRTGERIYLAVMREAGAPVKLRARLHGLWTDHLLQLPPCSLEEQRIG